MALVKTPDGGWFVDDNEEFSYCKWKIYIC